MAQMAQILPRFYKGVSIGVLYTGLFYFGAEFGTFGTFLFFYIYLFFLSKKYIK